MTGFILSKRWSNFGSVLYLKRIRRGTKVMEALLIEIIHLRVVELNARMRSRTRRVKDP
jgi:hypothetical protein